MDNQQQKQLLEIFHYMNMGKTPATDENIQPADGALVFCREDPAMATAAAALYQRGCIRWIVLTGGIGKDSGPYSRAAGSEAAHQKRLLIEEHRVPEFVIFTESQSHNGAENSRFGIDIIVQNGLPHQKIILVMPPRYARRLYAVHTKISRDEKQFQADYQVVCMNEKFDPLDPAHRQEVLNEFLRLAEWPDKGWCDPQPDFPQALLTWAKSQTEK